MDASNLPCNSDQKATNMCLFFIRSINLRFKLSVVHLNRALGVDLNAVLSQAEVAYIVSN